MTLVRYNPYRNLSAFSGMVDQFREDFDSSLSSKVENWHPLVDVSEYDDHYEFVAEVPGLKKDEIKVSLEDSVLTLSGEKQSEIKDEKKNYHRIERVFGTFERSFRLPKEIQTENIHAKHENGVLTVTVPKAEKV